MPVEQKHMHKGTAKGGQRIRIVQKIGIATDDAVKKVQAVRAGFSFTVIAKFQKATELPWTEISRFVAIPQRTLSRRQRQGKLQADESDRVLRASSIFDLAVDLFDGDTTEARRWLQSPQPGLGGETPLDFASTEVGAREVENLIGRLEHGVFA